MLAIDHDMNKGPAGKQTPTINKRIFWIIDYLLQKFLTGVISFMVYSGFSALEYAWIFADMRLKRAISSLILGCLR